MKYQWLFNGIAALGLISAPVQAQVPIISGKAATPSTINASSPMVTPIASPTPASPTIAPTIAGGGNGCSDGGCSAPVGSNCCDAVGFGGIGNAGYFGRGGLIGGGLGSRLTSFIKPSDHCFDDFISPMTNPTHFEDPRTLTEARFIYLRHKVPQAAGSGTINLYGLQLRAALTDRLSVIATQDGYIDSTNPLVDNGWADLSAGLKYNLFRDPVGQGLLSVGGTFDMTNGSQRSLQGNGDGVFNFFVSGAQKLNDVAHYMGAFGVRLPNDTAAETSLMYWSHHIDRKVTNRLYLLAEANWYHWLDSGAGGIPGVEGGDLFNLGSTNVTGNDIVTTAVGMKFKPSGHQEIGLAFEFPVTERRDVLDNRLTFDWIIRY
jgi:hypothetical protein